MTPREARNEARILEVWLAEVLNYEPSIKRRRGAIDKAASWQQSGALVFHGPWHARGIRNLFCRGRVYGMARLSGSLTRKARSGESNCCIVRHRPSPHSNVNPGARANV